MENYFNYFTEIEERFQRRRGTALLLSTLDWALIETWKDAGIPLEAVLRGIDAAFDAYERKPDRSKTRKVNSLAYCSQEVLAAAEEMKEAALGSSRPEAVNDGMDAAAVIAHLSGNAAILDQYLLETASPSAAAVIQACAAGLREIAKILGASENAMRLEDVERRLTVMEEKLYAALLTFTPEAELLAVRSEADRDIAPYRRKMVAAQIEQLHRQYVNKRLLERAKLPRLSLFYM